ncbi:MAG: CHAT domain-containing protein [Cyanobacteria bacterium P01_D01_bin.116]
MKKILILASNPTDTSKLRLDEEVREIQNAHKQAKNREEIEIFSEWAIRVDDLRRALLYHKPNIVHFCGHGAGDDGLVLENQYGQQQFVGGESLAGLFKLFDSDVECVVLNACYSEVQAEAIHQHINCVIGMNKAIGDKAAIKFATGFYDALANGRNYQDSFDFGWNAIDLKSIPESQIPQIKIKDSSKSLLSLDLIDTLTRKEDLKMAGRNIHMGSGNYNERIEGDYIQQQGSFAVGVNKGEIKTEKIAGTINEVQQQTLSEVAAEIQQLLEQLEKSYSTDTTTGKMALATEAIAQIENNPNLTARIFSALQVGSVKAFEQLLSHPAASFVIGALEDWQKTKGT